MTSATDHSSETIEEKLATRIRQCGCQNVTLKDILQVVFVTFIPIIISALTVISMENTTHIYQANRENDLDIARQRAFEVGNETTFTEFVMNIADVLLKASSQSISKLHYGIIRGLIAAVFQRKKRAIQYLHGLRILRRGSGPFVVSVLQLQNTDFTRASVRNIQRCVEQLFFVHQ
ncbi:unnamed protein product [Adineta ricciae]|uniref:Uncharacterized protein n=1 Tax=Adineta ricciae TaxID=249248 RepID=A0A816CG14_ADIRI|nr:unnamed protein product [Adineta ricciae]